MWVYSMFEGDNLDLAFAQFDLYLEGSLPGGLGSAAYLWEKVQVQAVYRAGEVPWLRERLKVLQRAESVEPALLQEVHGYMAAYYRWTRRHAEQPALASLPPEARDPATQRMRQAWRNYLVDEANLLVADDAFLVPLVRRVVYAQFDLGTTGLQQAMHFLRRRYGLDCISGNEAYLAMAAA
jgi:hypothetical protein